MLYALIGSLLVGALAVAYLLWRKSAVEKQRDVLKIQLDVATAQINTIVAANQGNQKTYTDDLARKDAEILTIKAQRDQALEKLAKTGAPGSVTDLLRMRATHKD